MFPIAPTLERQYIIKNLVLLGAGLIIGATVRGGSLHAQPDTDCVSRELFDHDFARK